MANLRRAVELDALATVFRYNLASLLLSAGRLDEAFSEMRQVLELNPSNRADIAAYALILQGRHDEVLELIEQWPAGSERAQCLALALHGLGRQADGEMAKWRSNR